MPPSSVAQRKRAAVPAPAIRKSFVDGFDVMPVGTPCPAPLAAGMITGEGGEIAVPDPLYSVDVPLPLFETQIGLVASIAMPHPLTRFGSILAATPGRSATSFVTAYRPSSANAGNASVTATASAATRPMACAMREGMIMS